MSQIQLERQANAGGESAPMAPAASIHKGPLPDPGGGESHPAGPASTSGGSGDAGSVASSSGGAAGAWEADDGLMDAMGLASEREDAGAETGDGEGDGAGDGAAPGKSGKPAGSAGKARQKQKQKPPPAKGGASGSPGGTAPADAVASGEHAGGAAAGGAATGGAGASGANGAGASGANGANGAGASGANGAGAPGAPTAPVQKSAGAAPIRSAAGIHETAAAGVSGSGGPLPHLDAVQASFGKHDVTGVSAHTGSAAQAASNAIGAEAYATGSSVAFGSAAPSLHTAAHEAAHVVQQRGGVQLKGGVGQVGDVYERHADTVADRVVEGKSAEGLLDQMAPSAGGAGGTVQAKVVQLDIKADLRKAMDGWGTDEDAIFRRCERATAPEAQAVLADAALMKELRSELDRGDMTRVLDGLRAPLPDKLRLAMQGWGTDEDYIHRSLLQASQAELQAVAANDALVRQLEGELGGDDLKQVLDRLNAGLARKLRFAIRGWGTDEEYLFRAIQAAPLPDVTSAAGDAGLLTAVDGDLSGDDLYRFRGSLARRVYIEGGNASLAFSLCMGSRARRDGSLRWIGDITVQRGLLDKIIVAGNPGDMVIQAFQSYWEVETTVVEGATAWNPATVIAVHVQLKLLPSQDTRAGVWNELQLTGNSKLVNRAAWNGSALIVGQNIDPATAGTQTYGSGSTLTAATAIGDTSLPVTEGPRFTVNEAIAVERTGANKDTAKVTAIAGNTLTVDTGMAKAHAAGAQVTPDDDSALHEVPYLDATVRHEIAHSVETTLGGVTGFTVGLGGWWTGTDIDTWANKIANAWTPNDGTTISAGDLQKIKDVITDAVKNQKGSLVTIALGLAADHPLRTNLGKNVPAIMAAEASLAKQDEFWRSPGALYLSNGKRFSVSNWYKCFMYCNDDVVTQRLADYQLYAPAEFFAEAYTVFYEEANKVGTPGFADADLGRHVRNAGQRDWIRANVHNRGQAPATPAPAASPHPATGAGSPQGVAHAGGASYGRHAGNPGP